MKESTTLLVLMLATIATGIIAAVAADESPSTVSSAVAEATPRESRQAQRSALLELYDVDRDGLLDRIERRVLRNDIRHGRFPVDLVGLPRHRRHPRSEQPATDVPTAATGTDAA